MNNIVLIVALGSIVSLMGTMLGSCMGIIIKNPSDKILGILLGFAGGLMLSIVMFDLIPESINNWSSFGTLVFCSIGICVIAIIDNILDFSGTVQNSHIKVALLSILGLMMHNFPEGIIMGCGFIGSQNLGLKMSMIISIHDIPEGMAVSLPLMMSKMKIPKIVLYAFLTALPTAIGVWIGVYIGNISKNVLGASLAFASGVMLYVVCCEMVPEALKICNGIISVFGVLSGIFMGLIIINVL